LPCEDPNEQILFEKNANVLIDWFVKSFKLKCTKTNMAFLLLGLNIIKQWYVELCEYKI